MRLVLQDQNTRRSIEDAIERLLALLDQYDGDADFEPANDDEPALGWVERGPRMPPIGDQSVHFAGDPASVDLELDESDWEDGGEAEPTLGAPERHPHPHDCRLSDGSQAHWADGARGDHERETDDDVEQDHGEMPEDLVWTSDPDISQASPAWYGAPRHD